MGHQKSDLGVRHIGFQNGRRRQPEIGYIFVSESTTNIKLMAEQTFSGQRNEYIKTNKKPMTAVAEIADRTVYSALINDHLANNILPRS